MALSDWGSDEKGVEGLNDSISISVVIITKNAERTIANCLDGLNWASEVVILDNGSDDQTPDIARAKGAKFHTSDWYGFGPQKNLAIDLALSQWVLSVDSDEFVTSELAAEIVRIIRSRPDEDVFEISRISNYCGREMRHSGWFPDYVPRLFRKGKARFSDSLVHERLLFEGKSKQLRSHLMHDSFHSPDDVLEKMNRYSSLGAQQLAQAGKSSSLMTAVLHGFGAFFKTYVIKAGFLDGVEGFFLAVSNAEGAYYKYVKLYYLNKQKR